MVGNDRSKGLEEGELLADADDVYFTKRCVCCTFWITFVFVLLSCGGVAAQIFFMDGNFLSGALSNDESKDVVEVPAEPVEAPWVWTTSGTGSSTFSPQLKKQHEFGDTTAEYDSAFPGSTYEMPLYDKTIRLTGINYKTTDGYLSGIQLKYSDDNVSPTFQTEGAKGQDFKEIVVSKTAAVRRMSMAVDGSNGIVGIRFEDKKSNLILEETWSETLSKKETDKMWVRKTFGSKEKLIGLKTNTSGDVISRIAWYTWEP